MSNDNPATVPNHAAAPGAHLRDRARNGGELDRW
jgi:hypothetical protein